MLTSEELALCNSRPTAIDRDRIPELYFLGNYLRKLPVSMTRMMENAYDWEHLPYIHSSSFGSIELVASGSWGWRAKAEQPPRGSNDHMLIELLVDRPNNYWATSTLSGTGAGVQIHTQAASLSEHEIEIDVRFYLDAEPESDDLASFALAALQEIYARLYDEDTDLMQARQVAVDAKMLRGKLRDTRPDVSEFFVGRLSELSNNESAIVDTHIARFCVRMWQDTWVVHSADCPHMSGPLEHASIDQDGLVTCPWHGYRFDIVSGKSRDGKCGNLPEAPSLVQRGDDLYLVIE